MQVDVVGGNNITVDTEKADDVKTFTVNLNKDLNLGGEGSITLGDTVIKSGDLHVGGTTINNGGVTLVPTGEFRVGDTVINGGSINVAGTTINEGGITVNPQATSFSAIRQSPMVVSQLRTVLPSTLAASIWAALRLLM